MIVTVKNIQTELDQVNSDISVNQKQLYQHFDFSTMEDDTLNTSANLSQEHKNLNAKLKDLKGKKDKLGKQLEKSSKETEKLSSELKPYKEKYEYMTSLLSADKSSK